MPKNLEGEDDRWIRVDDPYFAIARIMTRWFSARADAQRRVADKAVHRTERASSGQNVAVGPFATIGENVVIGN